MMILKWIKENGEKIFPTEEEFVLSKEDLEILHKINGLILRDIDADNLFREIVDVTTKYLNCSGTLFTSYDQEKGTLYPNIVSSGIITKLATNLLSDNIHAFEIKVPKVPLNLVQESFISNEVTVGKNLVEFITPPAPAKWTKVTQKLYRMKVIIAVPVYNRDIKYGVLVYSFSEDIEQRVVYLLKTYTSLIALALERALIFLEKEKQIKATERKNQELQILQKTTTDLVSNLDLEHIYHKAVDNIPFDLGYQGAILSIMSEDKFNLKIVSITESKIVNAAAKVLNKSIDSFSIDTSNPENQNILAVKSIKENKVFVSSDLKDAFYPVLSENAINAIQKIIGVKSVVTIPIIYSDKVRGAIAYFINDKTSEEITQEDKNLMQTFASEISIALQNAELLEETRKITKQLESQNNALEAKNKELDTIFRITNEIVTTLDPKEVAQRAVDTIPDELGYIGAMITLIDKENKSYRMISITSGEMGQKLKAYMLENNSSCKYDSQKRFNTIPHDNDHFMIGNSLEEAITSLVPEGEGNKVQKLLGINTIVNTPIKTRNKTVGVMSFFLSFEDDEEIRTTEFDLMQTFAYQVGIGLENARLFNQYQELTNELAIKNEQLEDYAEKEKDILDIMGHELRTPITIVRNSLSFLKMMVQNGNTPPEKVNHYIDVALRSAKREINIIETMLAATKVEADKIEIFRSQVNTKEIIDEALLGQKNNANKKGLEIKVEIPENIPDVFMDRSRGQEIVDNFLSNAVKYTQQGGVTIKLEEEGDFVRFNIIDTGMGIPESEMESLGKKFHRIKQHISDKPEGGVKDSKGNDDTAKEKRLYNVVRPGGTGLGLYVTFNLVKLHGGDVRVTSEIGKGSNFSFTMPKFVGQESEVDETKSKNLLEEYRMKKSGDKVSDQ